MLFVSEAFAMAPPQFAACAAAASGTYMLMQFFPLILMFVIFWFLLIRPQQKRAKAHKAMLAALKKGDYVMTSAGFVCRILEIDDEYVLIECGEAKLRMSRAAVGSLIDKDGKAIEPEPAKKK